MNWNILTDGSDFDVSQQRTLNLRIENYPLRRKNLVSDLDNELQTSFVFAEQNKTTSIENCGFTEPYFMDGDIIIDKGIKNSISNRDSKATKPGASNNPTQEELIITSETDPEMYKDPENAKFQYIVDSLQQDFNKRISGIYQISCQNRNNLLLLVEWMSISSPTLAASILLQRDDVIAKKVDGKLLVAPCKTKFLNKKRSNSTETQSAD
ncbi:unnamed protein product [Onchocerca ochengi]|uniref:DUF4806 domain-containing protein n=1 Tax=Onchocerca ochengi TaxID=42157 RepID=A0A182EQ30_ONCOC|nr:unnamed protein product [Onchocerca ochengi]